MFVVVVEVEGTLQFNSGMQSEFFFVELIPLRTVICTVSISEILVVLNMASFTECSWRWRSVNRFLMLRIFIKGYRIWYLRMLSYHRTFFFLFCSCSLFFCIQSSCFQFFSSSWTYNFDSFSLVYFYLDLFSIALLISIIFALS